MTRSFPLMLFGALLLPVLAQAQPAREGNIWNGKDHQPTSGEVQAQEKDAGVGLSQGQQRSQQDVLDAQGKWLLEQVARDRQAAPAGSNVYGVGPGGVVPITPSPR